MPFAEDLTAFLRIDEHATLAELDYVPVRGIFERPYSEGFGGVSTSRPTFLVQSADAAHCVESESLLRIGDTLYRVRSIEPDGTGMTLLTLELQL